MSGRVRKSSNRPQRVSVLNPLSRYCPSSSTAADYTTQGGVHSSLPATGFTNSMVSTYPDRRTRPIYNR